MAESNYDILKIQSGASKKDIRRAYRNLVLKLHSDRGGDDEQFKKIKRAYEDLRLGKKYPDSADERKEKAKFYSGDSDADQRRKNLLLSQDISREMKTAQEWAAALNRASATGQRLFGSKELGQIEFERKITKTLTIKGKFWAGNFTYDNPVMMWGSVTSPHISPYEKHKTRIRITNGDFRMIDSIRNRYDIDGGAKITVDNGNMEVGSVRGKRQRVEDPQGRVGMTTTKEHFSELSAPNGKKRTMNREQLTTLVRSKKAKTREAAYKSLFSKYGENKGVTGEIYQNIVLNWRDEGIEMRGFSSPIMIRNISNNIDNETTKTLLNVCKKNSKIFQKYFLQKAKLLGMKKLRRYDLYAPSKSKIKEKNYSYDKSVKLVLESLAKFSPVLSGYANNVFKKKHVDSIICPGKTVGAFCSTPSPKITPYVLVNFTGKSRDVFTLAHEIGHAIHSISASGKSILVSDASLPLAETASTFSEMLLYDKLSETVTKNEKKIMLSEKIDDFYATIGRQSFFTLFEIEAHKQIANSTTIDEISRTYLRNLNEQFGNSVKVSDDFGIEWSCIPHFHHAPFYCYAYAFGNLLALSLFQRYKKEGKSFVPTYIEILSAGGTKKTEKLLRESGIDITKPKFWQDGFDYIQDQVKELSKLN